jgi:hypothetical protein
VKRASVPLSTFFRGRPQARRLFASVARAVQSAGPSSRRVTPTQIVFEAERPFAWAWCPGRWLRGATAPLVLSIALPRRDRSPRWKEVVRPAPRRWMHHLELHDADDLDAEVRRWLIEAWRAARQPSERAERRARS